MDTAPLVSVIVPVYNVESYVSRCIESLLRQTYADIEILLIDDGSQDHSLEILRRYEKQDTRIRVFHKSNEGLGPTRNYGLRQARGKYVMYVDSDDYVLPTIMEKLLNSLREHQADISVCDRFNLTEKTGAMHRYYNQFPEGVRVVSVSTNPDIITRIYSMVWGKLYSREFLISHAIWQPDCEMEDVISYVAMALADRISYVPEPLYVYIRDRADSITRQARFIDNIDAHRVLVREFQSRGLYRRFEKQLTYIARNRASRMVMYGRRRQSTGWAEMEKRLGVFIGMVKDYLSEQGLDMGTAWDIRNQFCVFGSYNLSYSLKKMTWGEQPLWEYGSSSLISAMSPPPEGVMDWPVEAENAYRTDCLYKDLYKTLLHTGHAQVQLCRVVLLDFLEERYPVGRLRDGSCITVSDAFKGSRLWGQLEFQELEPFSEAFMTLWRERCDRFVELLKKRYHGARIILVKMFLAEEHGRVGGERTPFEGDWIDAVNCGLREMYAYFIQRHGSVETIEIPRAHFYTDDNFRHGCHPWHLNEEFYRELGGRIKRCLLSR